MKIKVWALKSRAWKPKQTYEGWDEILDCNFGSPEVPVLFMTREQARIAAKEGPIGDRKPKPVKVTVTIKEAA